MRESIHRQHGAAEKKEVPVDNNSKPFSKNIEIGYFLISTGYVPTQNNFLTVVVSPDGLWDFGVTHTQEDAEKLHEEMIVASRLFSDAIRQMDNGNLTTEQVMTMALPPKGSMMN